MRKLVLLAIAVMLPLTLTVAQDKTADIKRLMSVMQVDKLVDNTMQQMLNAMKQQITGQMAMQGDSAKDEFIGKFMEFVSSETTALTKKMLNEDLPSIYEKHFTSDEIKDVILFYESPTGKKLLEKSPEISGEIMNIMTAKYMPGFSQKINEKMKEIKDEISSGQQR
ncbi:MAG: DUF2059 domain-containing protein [Proteiniphilum sp.]|jgi:hypothetical protein|nr:DUF2059 domain-containing protein [Proteiniphilum sp.]